MLLAAVVATSQRVAETRRRIEKIDLLAALLRQLEPEEVQIVVAFLSGYTIQGRIGVGYAALRDAAAALTAALTDTAAETAGLEIREVDRVLSELAAVKGAGSDRQ